MALTLEDLDLFLEKWTGYRDFLRGCFSECFESVMRGESFEGVTVRGAAEIRRFWSELQVAAAPLTKARVWSEPPYLPGSREISFVFFAFYLGPAKVWDETSFRECIASFASAARQQWERPIAMGFALGNLMGEPHATVAEQLQLREETRDELADPSCVASMLWHSRQIEETVDGLRSSILKRMPRKKLAALQKDAKDTPRVEVPEQPLAETPARFAVPKGCAWDAVEWEFHGHFKARIAVAGKWTAKPVTFEELGFVGKSKDKIKRPSRQWLALLALALGQGPLSQTSIPIDERAAFEKQVSLLNVKLKKLFGLDSPPIWSEGGSFQNAFHKLVIQEDPAEIQRHAPLILQADDDS